MGCCGKRRRLQLTKLLKNSLNLLESFKDAEPRKLTDELLLNYHRKTHMLYAGNIKQRPLNTSFINSIVSLHNKFVKEILKRNMKHNTPLRKV